MSAWHTSISIFRMSRLMIEISSLRMFLRMAFQDLSSGMFWRSVMVRLLSTEGMDDVEAMGEVKPKVDVEAIVWGSNGRVDW